MLACQLPMLMQCSRSTAQLAVMRPERLRLRLFSVGGRLVRGGRRLCLRIAGRRPWAFQISTGIVRLQAFQAPT